MYQCSAPCKLLEYGRVSVKWQTNAEHETLAGMKSGCQRLYRLACQLDLEGIVAKRADSPVPGQ
jgi:ATP-dependent DNA ligase